MIKRSQAITPCDGRNRSKVEELSAYFSEFAYVKIRLFIEIEYLKHIIKVKGIDLENKDLNKITELSETFSDDDFNQIKILENELNHDVKAIEYYLKRKLTNRGLDNISRYVHWGLTSEDLNNLAYSLLLKDFKKSILIPQLYLVLSEIVNLINRSDFVILGRTHGQIASPTLLSKEINVFLARLVPEFTVLKDLELPGKMNGSIGTYSELYYSVAGIDWISENNKFISNLGLTPLEISTQILPPEKICEFFDTLVRIQNILINLAQDLWSYASIGYIKFENKTKEVGSSIMPQKINPIQLEAAEGGLQLSNAMFNFYSEKLSKSRLQRDLSDSTVKRSFGFSFGYTLLALKGLIDGMQRVTFDTEFAKEELNNHQEAFLSMIQTKERLVDSESYEKMKNKYKGRKISKHKNISMIDINKFLDPSRKLIKSSIKQFQQLLM